MPALRETVVVVGAGLAGLQTALALRQQGHTGPLTLVGAEPHPPYDRPPLSKDLLRGRVEDTTLDADLPGLGIELRTGTTALGLDAGEPGAGLLRTDAGELPFDALVIATGALPRALPGTRTLRTVDDARAWRVALRAGARLGIVGAGWIGAEVASSAAALGAQVTVVEALPAPLAGALPVDLGARTVPWYEAAGVRLRLGEPLPAGVDPGAALDADLVVSAVGVRPATDWLAGSGVDLDPRTGAVLVDDHLRTSRTGVYAVGDCAAWPSARYGRRLLVEHWDLALRAPAVVAANLLAGWHQGAARHDPVPYLWSDQFGHHLQYAGWHADGDRRLERPARHDDPGWTVGWLDGEDRLVAALAVDRPRELLPARKLIERGAAVDAARFADPTIAIKEAAR